MVGISPIVAKKPVVESFHVLQIIDDGGLNSMIETEDSQNAEFSKKWPAMPPKCHIFGTGKKSEKIICNGASKIHL